MTGAGQQLQLPYTDLPGKVFAPNLTPDKETGAGNWTNVEATLFYTHGLIRAAFARVYGFTTIFPDILTLFQMLCAARISRRGNAQWRKSQKWDSPKVTQLSSLIPQVGKLTCTYPWICIQRLAPRQL